MKRNFVLGFSVLAGALMLLCAPAVLAQQQAQSMSEKSYREARKVLEAGISAMGGLEALRAVRDVSRKGSGIAYNQGQSLKPDPPYTTRAVKISTVADFAGRRSHSETETTPQGAAPSRTRAVLKGDAAFTLNLVTNVVTPSTATAVTAAKNALRRDPAALLLTSLGRAETLRLLRPGVITFAETDGTQIGLYFTPQTGLLAKSETLADNAVLGDTTTEIVFSDYRPVGGIKLPFHVVNRTAGEVTLDLKYTEITTNTRPADGLFEMPAGAEKGTPSGPATTVEVTKLADDVHFIAGSTHNSLLVIFGDHVLLVDAPQSDERSRAVIAKIKELAPGKPIRYVVPTHFHYDHAGGIRTYIAEGATIVTTPGNKGFIEKLAATAHTIKPDALSLKPRKPVIETFARKKVFTAGARTIELHEVGPNPHVAEVVVAYLPKGKTVFVADLFGIPLAGPIPEASPATRDFASKVRSLGLQVERIAPAHGKLGSIDDLNRALGTRAAIR